MSEPTEYARMAEFHDLFMDERWQHLTPFVRECFGGLDGAATIVDIGAGGGMGVAVLAGTITAARIYAVEPDLAMRTMLMGRLIADPHLAGRVTVYPDPAPDCFELLPARVDGAMCTNMLGHVDGTTREALFAWLARALTPSGVALVTIARDPVPESQQTEQVRRVGDLTYAFDIEATPGGHRSVYRVLDGERVLRELRVDGSWDPFTAGQAGALAARNGLCADLRPGEGVALITREA